MKRHLGCILGTIPVARVGAPIPNKKPSQKRLRRALVQGAINKEQFIKSGGNPRHARSF